MLQDQNTQHNDNLIEKKQFYFGAGAAIVFLILTVLLYVFFRTDMQQSDWVAFYVLIGLIGGLVFYLVDPLRSQDFKWKGIANLSGAAAVGAFFMFFADYLTPAQDEALTMEELFFPPYTSWVPMDKSTGKPETVQVKSLNKSIPLPENSPFKNFNLTLVEQEYDYFVTLEDDPQIYFGKLEKSDFERGNLSSKLEFISDDLQIRRISINNEYQGNYPFSVQLYKDGESLKFRIYQVEADSVLVDRAANKELNRILMINKKFYLVMVVLSVPNHFPSFAEFALGEIKPIFR